MPKTKTPKALSPLARYEQFLECEGFVADPAQRNAVLQLEGIYQHLTSHWQQRRSGGLFQRIFGGLPENKPVKGLYMWGGVGRGKTFLMDVFFESLPTDKKMRLHFHRFMMRVHDELRLLNLQKNPLAIIARKLASETDIICFDEFFVSDITDAMLLGELFKHLFFHNVSLIATSNIPPDDLYRNGLQRERFLPAIALIKQHTRVLQVDGGADYRLRTLEQANLYYYPNSMENLSAVQQLFVQLAVDAIEQQTEIEILGRQIKLEKLCDDVAWFTFDSLCATARSQRDYIELSKIFHTVVVSNMPRLGQKNDDAARRFISLVDEFYERNVKLILVAEVKLADLYGGGRLSFEFQRCISRLQEMQSTEFLAKEHLA